MLAGKVCCVENTTRFLNKPLRKLKNYFNFCIYAKTLIYKAATATVRFKEALDFIGQRQARYTLSVHRQVPEVNATLRHQLLSLPTARNSFALCWQCEVLFRGNQSTVAALLAFAPFPSFTFSTSDCNDAPRQLSTNELHKTKYNKIRINGTENIQIVAACQIINARGGRKPILPHSMRITSTTAMFQQLPKVKKKKTKNN